MSSTMAARSFDGSEEPVEKLLANGPVGWIMVREEDAGHLKTVIADRRHRLLAVLDVAERHGDREVPILYGERGPRS